VPQLTPSAIKQVQDALSKSLFSLTDFDIQLPDKGDLLLTVEFRHKAGYKFQIIETRERSKVKTSLSAGSFGPVREETSEYTVMYTLETPGAFKLRDRVEIEDFSAALDRIPGWCEHIKENLSVAPLAKDAFEDFRVTLEEQMDKQGWSDDERFNKEEIDRLTNKLQELAERFEKLQEQNSVTQEQVDQIKKQLAELGKNASRFPKRIWGKVAGNKMMEIVMSFFKSKEGRDLFIEGIKKLISG
jgi:hypothetical protein